MSAARHTAARPYCLAALVTVAAVAAVAAWILTASNAWASTENVVAKVLPSVVTVRGQGAQGSAFAFGKPGQFITNFHVVKGSPRVVLTSVGGVGIEGYVAATDAGHDLALIQSGIHPYPLLPAVANPKIGADVLAIGSPLGLDGSVSKGIISAINRKGNGAASIQTNIALNPGNSGGPLIDAQGRVIGVNTSVADASQGIGFAVPIKFAQQLIARASSTSPSAAANGGISRLTIAAAAGLLALILALITFRLVKRRREQVRIKLKSSRRKRFFRRNAAPDPDEEIVVDLYSESAK